MNNKIWIVEGSTGEYSDHSEWPIAFYEDEDLAKRHVEKAAARYREINVALGYSEDGEGAANCGKCYRSPRYDCEAHKDLRNEWDPDMSIDYTGTNYRCYSVERGTLELARS